MKTGELLEAVRSMIVTDPLIMAPFVGGDVFCREAAEFEELQIPGIVMTVATDTEGETFETIRIRFAVYARDTATEAASDLNRAMRAALRRLFHHEVETEIGGLWLTAQYLGSVPLDDPEIGVAAVEDEFEFGVFRAKITG